jgi:hypothetical protein
MAIGLENGRRSSYSEDIHQQVLVILTPEVLLPQELYLCSSIRSLSTAKLPRFAWLGSELTSLVWVSLPMLYLQVRYITAIKANFQYSITPSVVGEGRLRKGPIKNLLVWR